MKRIITWGIRYSDYDIQRELFAMRANGEVEIVAEVMYDPADEEIFYCRKPLDDALALDYDYIVVPGGAFPADYMVDSVADALKQAGYEEDIKNKIISVQELAMTSHERVLADQISVIRDIVHADDSQIADRKWMRDRLSRYGFFPFFKLVKTPQQGITWSTYGILQVPDEFIDFCMHIAKIKCNRAIEIGVARGGSSYVMAALLYRNNPDLIYRMVDISDDLVNYDRMKVLIPALEKCIPSTSADHAGESYDFCFIDADHSYRGMMDDYDRVGRNTSCMTVFHDIYGHEYDNLDGGTVRGWQEIKALRVDSDSETITEYSRYPDKWMGLGLVEKTQ